MLRKAVTDLVTLEDVIKQTALVTNEAVNWHTFMKNYYYSAKQGIL